MGKETCSFFYPALTSNYCSVPKAKGQLQDAQLQVGGRETAHATNRGIVKLVGD